MDNIILKHCNTCGLDKPLDLFYISKANKDGHSSQCKECINKRQKKYNDTHKEQIRVRDAKYRLENADKIQQRQNSPKRKAYEKQYREQNKNRMNQQSLSWYYKNKEYALKRQQKYNKNNPEIKKAYYIKNRDKILEYQKQYRIKNADILREKDKQRQRENKLTRNFSTAIYASLKGRKNEIHWENLVPYTLNDLKQHLEKQFDDKMNWNNYGEYWEIDHIIPVNTFNITDYNCRDFQICWSLMNLRPLYWEDNRSRPKDGRDISENLRQQILNQ